MSTEVSHYVVTAHPPGAVLLTTRCNFLYPDSKDVICAKSRRVEVRRATQDESSSPFPIVLQLPINGRITSMIPITSQEASTDYLFLTTDRYKYAVISYSPDSTPYPVRTHASGSLRSAGREPAVGPLVTFAPNGSCLALHVYDGIITFIPIHSDYKPSANKARSSFASSSSLLGEPYQVRVEERAILDLKFLYTPPGQKDPHLCILHQDSRNAQHAVTYAINVRKKTLTAEWKKSRVDGGSCMLLAVPPFPNQGDASSTTATGGVVVVGQRQVTYLQNTMTKVVPLASCLMTAATFVPESHAFLLGDEFGNLHFLKLTQNGMQMETLGSCNIASSLEHLHNGLTYVASSFGDSQLIQIHKEPLPIQGDDGLQATTFLQVVEEYTNLGPIVDFDLVPTHAQQSQVVTCSGSSTTGSLRLVRNGIGMNECASVEIQGIQNMWSLARRFGDKEHAYLVQSFVGETRVLGVATDDGDDDAMEDEDSEDAGGTLEEVVLSGLDSTSSSLYVGNVQVGDTILQITESEVRLISASTMEVATTWTPDGGQAITVATANQAGQIALSLRGGILLYLRIKDASTIEVVHKTTMESEVSCVDLNPFVATDSDSAMDVDDTVPYSKLVAVGLWDDFTVRLLSLESSLEEVLSIGLSTDDQEESDASDGASRKSRSNMMAGSLCLITLDSTNTANSSGSVDMLFVGLGDGTLVSFAILERNGRITANSRKEVNIGTQRIGLVPLQTEQGGRCVLATGDRPTVIYLAGGGGGGAGGTFSNPKLCYSNVNLSTSEAGDEDDDVNRPPAQQSIAVNVATPFVSSHLFDVSTAGMKHFSLCVSDASNLRLGVIDDIQKLHVTTCRLGMAPRRVVYCSEDRMFAVGCIESGLNQGGSVQEDVNMGNCIRFLDDTTFEDIHRIDLEPFEMVLSMTYVNLGSAEATSDENDLNRMGDSDAGHGEAKPYLLIGTGYALPDEDEPTRGRIMVLSCLSGGTEGSSRGVRHVTELQVRGGVYSMCQFYDHKVLATVNTKTQVCQLADDGTGMVKLSFVGIGHHGHVLSLLVRSKAKRTMPSSKSKYLKEDDTMMEDTPTKKKPARTGDVVPEEQLAIVGDIMRSISLVRYYPEHKALEEIARDFNANWTTSMEMLTDNIYLGAENWNNLFVLRRNVTAQSEEVRCRLDTIGEFHLGEMCNKFMCGSLIMPHSTSSSSGRRKVALRMTTPVKGKKDGKVAASVARAFRPTVTIGTQTLYATVDGTLGAILGLDARTAAFFKTLERAMAKTIAPVGDLSHAEFRAFDADRRVHPSHGFVDGDMVESFLDLDRESMEDVVEELNRDGGWDVDSFALRRNDQEDDEDDEGAAENPLELTVEDVLAMVEEMTMFH